MTYSISNTGGYDSLFKMSGDSGVQLVGDLDFDDGSPHEYTVTLLVEDKAGNKDTMQVKMTVTDTNDNKPEWLTETKPHFYVSNKIKQGGEVGTLQAVDKDSQSTGFGVVKYQFEGKPPNGLTINSKTGVITVTQNFGALFTNGVNVKLGTFIVVATDSDPDPGRVQKSEALEVTVTVVAEETLQPRFEQRDYTVNPFEGTELVNNVITQSTSPSNSAIATVLAVQGVGVGACIDKTRNAAFVCDCLCPWVDV